MWEIFLDIIFYLAEAAVGLLPTYTPSNNGMVQSLVNALGMFNQWFPIYELTQCMIAYLAFCVLYMGIKPILKFGRLS